MYAAVRSRITARTRLRAYSSVPQSSGSSSNLPLFLGGAGLLGLGGYLYLNSSGNNKPHLVQKKQEKSPLDPNNFIDFKLKRVEPYNHNTAKFVFELPDNEASLLPVASCLVVKSSDPDALKDSKGNPIIRPYTPISPPDAPGELTLMVKKYDNGNASKYIHELKPGEKLAFKGPIPKWPYKTNEFEEVALIGGGSGITPLFQILNHALQVKENTTKFTLVFSNVTEKDILLREDIDALQAKYPKNLQVIYTLTKPDENWKGLKGYVNNELVKKTVAPASLKEKVMVFVCGPPGQVATVAGPKDGMKQGKVGGILKELGYTEEQVYKF